MVPIVDVYVIDRIHAVELLPLLNRGHRSGGSRMDMIVNKLSRDLSDKRVLYPTYYLLVSRRNLVTLAVAENTKMANIQWHQETIWHYIPPIQCAKHLA